MAAAAATPEVQEDPPAAAAGAGAAAALTTEQLYDKLRPLCNAESIHVLTVKTLRQHLEKTFGLEEGALNSRKDEIKQLSFRLVDEVQHKSGKAEDKEEKDERNAEQPHVKRPRTSTAPTESLKEEPQKSKGDADAASESAAAGSSSASSSSAYDEGEEDASSSSGRQSKKRKNKKRAKAKTGARAQQQRLMTKAAFQAAAPSLAFTLGDDILNAKLDPRVFATGSCGWYFGSKVQIPVGDKSVTCQLGINCTVVGSKAWKAGNSTSGGGASEGA